MFTSVFFSLEVHFSINLYNFIHHRRTHLYIAFVPKRFLMLPDRITFQKLAKFLQSFRFQMLEIDILCSICCLCTVYISICYRLMQLPIFHADALVIVLRSTFSIAISQDLPLPILVSMIFVLIFAPPELLITWLQVL